MVSRSVSVGQHMKLTDVDLGICERNSLVAVEYVKKSTKQPLPPSGKKVSRYSTMSVQLFLLVHED